MRTILLFALMFSLTSCATWHVKRQCHEVKDLQGYYVCQDGD